MASISCFLWKSCVGGGNEWVKDKKTYDSWKLKKLKEAEYISGTQSRQEILKHFITESNAFDVEFRLKIKHLIENENKMFLILYARHHVSWSLAK